MSEEWHGPDDEGPRVFTAEFSSWRPCPVCAKRIREGDEICYDNLSYDEPLVVHAECLYGGEAEPETGSKPVRYEDELMRKGEMMTPQVGLGYADFVGSVVKIGLNYGDADLFMPMFTGKLTGFNRIAIRLEDAMWISAKPDTEKRTLLIPWASVAWMWLVEPAINDFAETEPDSDEF